MLWLVLATAVAVVFLLVRARFWEYGPCPRCTRKGRGKAGRGLGSGGRAWNRCGACGGKGERVRPLARIYPRWREDARARKRSK